MNAEGRTPDKLLRDMAKLYREEIRYVDDCIGALLTFLKGKGIYDNTSIILTADHGEMFNEHKRIGHPSDLYDELLKVPLIIKDRNIPRDNISGKLISLRDIPHTIYHMAVGKTSRDYSGYSILDLMKKGKGRDFVCSKAKHLGKRSYYKDDKNMMDSIRGFPYNIYSIRTNRYKLIYDDENDLSELYDLKEDKKENNNIIDVNKELTEGLKDLMITLIKKYRTREEKKGLADIIKRKRIK